jgi:hypothetical protein
MRTTFIIVILVLTSCADAPVSKAKHFERNLPDTSKTWCGRQTMQTFLVTRQFENKLKLNSLQNGVAGTEFRIWNLSGSLDPQCLTILRSTNQNWFLRRLKFNYSRPDSLLYDTESAFALTNIDSLDFVKLWHLNSQSDLINGDQFGCTDSNVIFIELSDWSRYRFSWYNCPSINRCKDSVFMRINEMLDRINKISKR